MNTKKYKNIFSYLGAFTMAMFIASCSQEDNTEYSTLSPTAPSISIADNTPGGALIEDDQVYEFIVTLSEKQLVDVKVFAKQVGGDATIGDDFELSSTIVIPAGSMSGKGTVKILKDDEIEDTETLTIQIGDEKTANASIAPANISFTILNYVEGDLAVDMSWMMASTTTDNSGEEIDPEDFANVRILVSSTPDNTGDIDQIDYDGFKTYVLSNDLPDGDYYITVDFDEVLYPTINRDLNIDLNFNQVGVISGTSLETLNALNSFKSCPDYFHVIAKIVKSGTDYTITQESITNVIDNSAFIGIADVLIDEWADDYVDGKITIEPGSNDFEFYVRMYSNPYIDNPDTAYLIVTIDPETSLLTGVSNEPWDYGNSTPVTATGTLDVCNKIIDLNMDYFYGESTHYKTNLVLQLP